MTIKENSIPPDIHITYTYPPISEIQQSRSTKWKVLTILGGITLAAALVATALLGVSAFVATAPISVPIFAIGVGGGVALAATIFTVMAAYKYARSNKI